MGLIGNLKNKKSDEKPAPKPDQKKAPDSGVRSDDGHAKKECLEQASTLIKLGIGRADVLTTLQKRFVGLPKDVIEALVATVPDAEGSQGINPADSPEEPEEIVEEKPKGKGRAKKESEKAPSSTPEADRIAKAINNCLDKIASTDDFALASGALLNVAHAIKLLRA